MTRSALFEIGLEELPARFIVPTIKQLETSVSNWLKENRISYDSIDLFSTPRRLAVRINRLQEQQETLEEEVRGPSLKIAKDAEGNWTKAAEGFARGQGKSVDDLYIKKEKKTEYIFVKKVTEGLKTEEILQTFGHVIKKMPIQAQMRWGTKEFRFIRPIRWLVGLYDEAVVPFEIANIKSSNKTEGHRFLGEQITLDRPENYETLLEKQFVIVDRKKREKLIAAEIKQLEEEGAIEIPLDQSLLDEVTDLVEYPTAFVGRFDPVYLNMPKEILITSMKEHQRYFPTYKQDELQPYFVAVRNGDRRHIDHVQKGNERVLSARLSDAEFFYQEDLKLTIDGLVERLKHVVFQEKLGTYYDKITRVKQVALSLNEILQLNIADEDVERAVYISKFDLETNVVHEFTELQGIIGSHYARHFKEKENVSEAIQEQYMPTSAKGQLPETDLGALLAVSDKVDTIVGCIMAGLIPTGSRDPYGLRREAIGVLRILLNRKWNVSVEELFRIAQEQFPIDLHTNELEVSQFIKQRIHYLLADLGIEQDVIEAVTDRAIGQMKYMIDKAQVLSKKRQDQSFKKDEEALVRVLNIIKDENDMLVIDPHLFETESERVLYEKYCTAKEEFIEKSRQSDAIGELNALVSLTDQINEFFEHNMVMVDDESIRNNRLALLAQIRELIRRFANLRLIEWNQTYDM